MFSTQKEKISFLHNLKKRAELQDTSKLIQIAQNHPYLERAILKSVLESLSSLDLKITVFYDYTEQDDWEYINANYDTPKQDDYAEIKEDVRVFVTSYQSVSKLLQNNILLGLNLLSDVLVKGKTRNIQYLLFSLCLSNPLQVLSFLLHKIKEKGSYTGHFIVLLFGLLVRFDFETKAIQKCVKMVIQDLGGPFEVIILQNLLYLCCFKKQYFTIYNQVIMRSFQSGIVKFLNSNVVDTFCNKYHVELKLAEIDVSEIEYLDINMDLLRWFPFDKPVLDDIFKLYKNKYVVFNKS